MKTLFVSRDRPTVSGILKFINKVTDTSFIVNSYIIGHYNPSVRIIRLVSRTTYDVCDNFIHKWLDLQFNGQDLQFNGWDVQFNGWDVQFNGRDPQFKTTND